tara:strand:- start:111 stop:647 length:537 start_codon:yes stop_codon:yes gene_type:complete
MKSFQQFITEASQDSQELDDVKMSKRADTPLKVGRIGANTKKSPAEKKRVKAVGGGKTAPAKNYKDRKDIGTNKPISTVRQQPTQKRGSASLSLKDQQKKARAERMAGKSGGKSKEELKKAANKLLRKKKAAHPDYKPQKASGYTAHERRKIRRAGERLVKDIKNKKEKHISHYDPKV